MKREAFLMYGSFYELVSDLADEQLGRLFRAIFQCSAGEDVQVAPDICMAFNIFKKQQEEYEKFLEKQRENGRKGGAPRGNQNAKKTTQNNPKQPKTTQNNPKQPKTTQNNPKQPKTTQNNPTFITNSVSDNYSAKNRQNRQKGEKETENEKENEKEKVIQKEKDKEKDKEKESVCVPVFEKNRPISDDYRRFIDWMRENAPYCNSHMTLPTEKEFLSLKQMWAAADIADQILNIENRLDLRKKYKSLYRTLLNWLKRDNLEKKKYTA